MSGPPRAWPATGTGAAAGMDYELSIVHAGEYLHVRASGKVNYGVALDAWRRIVQACDEFGCYKVLGEQLMDNALTTLDAWDHQKIFAEAGVTHRMTIAWVDLNPATIEATRFVETILLNRGLVNGRLFGDVDSARAWLLGHAQ